MRYSQSDVAIENDATIGDGVILDGARIRFTNTAAGRIIGGVTFNQPGSTLINELGGIVRSANGTDPYTTVVITGSNGSDTVLNAGLVSGLVRLGGGADRYTTTGVSTYEHVDLGDGDDLFEASGGATAPFVEGGAGTDTFQATVSGQQVVSGAGVTGFETLALTGNGQFFGFSGYRSIVLGAPLLYGMTLGESSNPLVDLTLAGNSLRLYKSSLRSITGSDAAETVELAGDGSIGGKVTLGGGDDRFILSSLGTETPPVLPGAGVDGGAGKDGFQIQLASGSRQTLDFIGVTGFESLSVNAGYQASGRATISHLSGVSAIDIGNTAGLALVASHLPTANVTGAFGGSISLDAGSSIGRYGFPLDGPYDQRTDIAQGDDRLSVTLTNQGRIEGDVVFYLGDDRYDGSGGTIGGKVYGNAGNDTLIGGSGNDWFDGGWGSDTLVGGDGDDRLDGGANADRLGGGAGNDLLIGGAGNDVLDGGTGVDRAAYTGLFESYAPSTANGTTTLRGGAAEGTDTLTGVEYVTFKDATMIADPDAIGSQIIRLYDAVLGRAPDRNGLDFYLDRIEDRGGTLLGVAEDLIGSGEFRAATGSLSNAQFVDYVYQHALGRAADAGGRAYYTGELDRGLSRAAMMLSFSESAEHRALTANLVAQGHVNTDDTYQAVALLYDGAFGRLPDAGGLVYYADRVKAGQMTLAQVAADFAGSAEFTGAIRGKSNGEIVDFIYQNTLDRAPDTIGRAFYTDRLDKGGTVAQIFQEIGLSPEHYNLYAPHITYGIDIV